MIQFRKEGGYEGGCRVVVLLDTLSTYLSVVQFGEMPSHKSWWSFFFRTTRLWFGDLLWLFLLLACLLVSEQVSEMDLKRNEVEKLHHPTRFPDQKWSSVEKSITFVCILPALIAKVFEWRGLDQHWEECNLHEGMWFPIVICSSGLNATCSKWMDVGRPKERRNSRIDEGNVF